MVLAVHDGQQTFSEARDGLRQRHIAFRSRRSLQFSTTEVVVDAITIQQSDDILNLLAEVALHGRGFTTDCLLDYVLDEGFTEPIYLNASGEDPDAYFKGKPNAWAIYQIREWKRVLTVSGGPGKDRRVQITETP